MAPFSQETNQQRDGKLIILEGAVINFDWNKYIFGVWVCLSHPQDLSQHHYLKAYGWSAWSTNIESCNILIELRNPFQTEKVQRDPWPWDPFFLFHTTLYRSCQLVSDKWPFKGAAAVPLWRWYLPKMEWYLPRGSIYHKSATIILICDCVLNRYNAWLWNPREGNRRGSGFCLSLTVTNCGIYTSCPSNTGVCV